MKCEICGNEIPEGYKYCPVCGDPVFVVDITQDPEEEKKDKKEDAGQHSESKNKLADELKKNRDKLQKSEKKIGKRINKKKTIIGAIAAIVCIVFVYCIHADSACFYKRHDIIKAEIIDVEDPTILFVEGMFFASNGKVLQDGFTRKYEITDISYNEDQTKAVFLRGEECYYIDAALKPRLLTSQSDRAVMSKRGTKAYFNDLKKGCVSVYDSETDEIRQISDEGTMERSCVSPDGNTLALYRPGDKSISIITPDKAPTRIVSGLKNLSAIAVSDDGKRVFYRTYNHDIYAYYFYNDKKTTTVSTGYYLRECINYDCTELLAFYRGAMYFNSEMEKGISLIDVNITSVVVRGSATAWVDGYYSTYYVGVDSLEPSLLKDEKGGVYYFPDHESDVYRVNIPGLGDDEIRLIDPEMNSVLWLQDNALGIYSFYKDGIKYATIDAINVKGVYNYSYNDDLSVIWISTFKGDLYLYRNGTCTKVMEGIKEDIKYDKLTERTFFIQGKNLYSVKDSMDSMKLEMENCRRFSVNYTFMDYVEFMGEDGYRYAYIFGNIVKED